LFESILDDILTYRAAHLDKFSEQAQSA